MLISYCGLIITSDQYGMVMLDSGGVLLACFALKVTIRVL